MTCWILQNDENSLFPASRTSVENIYFSPLTQRYGKARKVRRKLVGKVTFLCGVQDLGQVTQRLLVI